MIGKGLISPISVKENIISAGHNRVLVGPMRKSVIGI